MKAKTTLVIFIVLGGLFLICSPILLFVAYHLKDGYDNAERKAASEPKIVTPPPPPEPDHKEILARLAKFDFKSVDFSKNSFDVTHHTDHFVEKLPPLTGSGKWGFTDGMVVQGRFELRGGVESIVGASSQKLQSSASSGGQATVEVAVEEGRVRAYVTGLQGSVTSGNVFVEATPGNPGRVTGFLDDWSNTGSPYQSFTLEALDGEAHGISYRVYRK